MRMERINIRKIMGMLMLVLLGLLLISLPVSAKSRVKLNKTKITVTAENHYQLRMRNTSKKVKWKSSNKKVATVSGTGLVTAKKKGKAKITAKIGKKKYVCRVTVKAGGKSSAAAPVLDHTVLGVTKGKSGMLKVTGTKKSVTSVSSSNKKVATVKKTGARKVKITGKKDGTCLVKVRVAGKTLKCRVKVSSTTDYSGAEKKNSAVSHGISVSIVTSLTYPDQEKECREHTEIDSGTKTFDTVTIKVKNNYSKKVKITAAGIGNLEEKTGYLYKTAWAAKNSYGYSYGEHAIHWFYHQEIPGNIYGSIEIAPGEEKTITYYSHIPKSVYQKTTWDFITSKYGEQYLTDSYDFYTVTAGQKVTVKVAEYPYRSSTIGQIGEVTYTYWPYTNKLEKSISVF